MNLNQSILSQSNKHNSTTRKDNILFQKATPSSTKATSSSVKPQELPSSQNVQSNDKNYYEVKTGQLLKGEIIDIRYNEIMIQLENNDQIISAKLENGVELTIGQLAQFQVIEGNSDRLTLKYIPNEQAPQQNIIIEKALLESGLPKSDKNKAIVQELLNHNLSISKQTLQQLVKQSHINKNASPQTLVLMFKHHLPMTKEHILQFEAYQSGTNQMLGEIHDLQKNLLELLQQGQDYTNETPQYNQGTANTLNQNLLELLLKTEMNRSFASPDDPLANLLSKEELAKMITTLEQSIDKNLISKEGIENGTDLLKEIYSGTMSLRELVPLLNDLNKKAQTVSTNETLLKDISNATISDKLSKDMLHDNLNELSLQQNKVKYDLSSLTSSLNDRYQLLRQDNGEIGTFLNASERINLTKLLPSLIEKSNLTDQILNGTAKTNEVLNIIKNHYSKGLDMEPLKLLQAPEYIKLLDEAFHQKWTITPGQLSKENAVSNFYELLHQDANQLKELVTLYQGNANITHLQESAKNVQDNINFMKSLNELFTYVQLPVQLKDQDVHSELYVFTKKKALQDKTAPVNVLLHLDMPNLGPLDIHINLNLNNIHAVFYLDNIVSGEMIKEHLPLLTNSLGEKGFHLRTEVKQAEQKLDFSKDFIEHNTQDSDIKRYTFDIRT